MPLKTDSPRQRETDAPQATAGASRIAWAIRGSVPSAMVLGLSLCLGAPALATVPGTGRLYIADVGGSREGVFAGSFSTGPIDLSPSPSSTALSGTNWYVSASADDSAGGTVSTSAQLVAPHIGDDTYVSKLLATAGLRYAFTIEGPDPDALIPVLLTAAGSVTVSSGGGAGAVSLGFTDDSQSFVNEYASLAYGPAKSAGFSVAEIFYLHPDHLYHLLLNSEAQTNVHYIDASDGVAWASASVDPTFQIQGGFAGLYHFVGLPESSIGGPPGSAVPEPATWALYIAGLGWVGSAMRRRRRPSLASPCATPVADARF